MRNLLDRYIIKELVGPFFFGMAAFTAIIGGGTILFPLVNEAVKYGVGITLVAQIFIFKLPSVIVFTFPMSMLLASILAFGRLSSDLEVIAFRSSGIGVFRLIVPVALAGLVVSCMTIFFNEAVVPKSSHYAEELLYRALKRHRPTIRDNVNLTEYDRQGLPLRIINVLKVDGEDLQGITVAEFDDGQLARLVRSKTGRWLAAGAWEFYDGVMHTFPLANPKKVYLIEFKKEYIHINIDPLELGKREKLLEEMNAMELSDRIARKARLGQDTTGDLVNFHSKFSIPFTSLIFALLGATVGLRPHRSSSTMGLGLSLVIIIIYYILYSVGMGMGLAKVIPPIMAAWVPNILVALAAGILLKKVASQ